MISIIFRESQLGAIRFDFIDTQNQISFFSLGLIRNNRKIDLIASRFLHYGFWLRHRAQIKPLFSEWIFRKFYLYFLAFRKHFYEFRKITGRTFYLPAARSLLDRMTGMVESICLTTNSKKQQRVSHFNQHDFLLSRKC
ncbi:hypothetical protein D8B25_19225 [Verminephrobacter aporrectodeae subsp. tuberculatae]|nr:hypothetical protein [Verminephrobacter aporrectodeae subsp. tuberculatae]MCW8204875.1 hypothetical protein [Verminephrobacter aporrectodeae subsp. tuberculatae]